MIIRVIDCETCGLPPNDVQVVEIATVDLHGEGDNKDAARWSRGRMWSSLVNPGRHIPPEASAIHHITDQMVADAPTIEQVIADVTADVGDNGQPQHYAAHEAAFERAALPALADKITICTRKCAVVAWPDAGNHKNQTLRYYLNLKLADPALAQPHRAMGDCYVTAAILNRLLSIPNRANDGLYITIEDLIAISASPVLLPRFTFGQHAMKPIADVPTSYLQWIVGKSNFEDEDILHTARTHLATRRAEQRARSPV